MCPFAEAFNGNHRILAVRIIAAHLRDLPDACYLKPLAGNVVEPVTVLVYVFSHETWNSPAHSVDLSDFEKTTTH